MGTEAETETEEETMMDNDINGLLVVLFAVIGYLMFRINQGGRP